MTSFNNFKTQGFVEHNWQKYIEDMINLDELEIQVLFQPPQAMLRSKGNPNRGNIKLQYTYDLEPRKIAHQILTVREDVSGELIKDLGCIKNENREAIIYAENKLAHGVEVAEKKRNMVRMGYLAGSTPLREKTFASSELLVRIRCYENQL